MVQQHICPDHGRIRHQYQSFPVDQFCIQPHRKLSLFSGAHVKADIIPQDRLQKFVRLCLPHLQFNARILLLKLRDDCRKHVSGPLCRHAKHNTAFFPKSCIDQLFSQVVTHQQDLPGCLYILLPCVSNCQRRSSPVKQLHPHILLHLGYDVAEGRLGDIKFAGRGSDAAAVRYGCDIKHFAKIHALPPGIVCIHYITLSPVF